MSNVITSCTRSYMSEMRSLGLGSAFGIKKRDLSALAARDSRIQRMCRYDENTYICSWHVRGGVGWRLGAGAYGRIKLLQATSIILHDEYSSHGRIQVIKFGGVTNIKYVWHCDFFS